MKTKILFIIVAGMLAFLVGAGFAKANMTCGIPPIPSIGCKIGACVCDNQGNCYWQQICN